VSPVYRCVSPACRYVSLRVQKLTVRDRWLSVTRRSSKVFVYALTARDWELAAPPYFLAVFIFGSAGQRHLATAPAFLSMVWIANSGLRGKYMFPHLTA
jgi:hypothetical protein